MEFVIEARVNCTGQGRGKASVHIVFDDGSSMTVSNVGVLKEGEKISVKMPPMGRRPDITLRGDIKQKVEAIVKSRFQEAACSWSGTGDKCTSRAKRMSMI